MSNSTATAPRPALTLNLLHDFELCRAGQLVTMSPSAQRLVSFVALQDRPVRRAQVSSALWMDASEDRASASLRSTLWRIPAPDGVDVVTASNTHVWLNPHIEVDYRRTIADAHGVFDGPTETMIDVARELRSYGEDLLPGWYDDWVVMERERFRQLRLHALDRLGTVLCDRGRYSDAMQLGLAALHSEPLHESAYRLIVRIHIEQGNVAEAVRVYRNYERTLAAELGAVPSKAMRAMVSACFDRSPPSLVGGRA
jgi:DNA-binding SARP family transcriptional activator